MIYLIVRYAKSGEHVNIAAYESYEVAHEVAWKHTCDEHKRRTRGMSECYHYTVENIVLHKAAQPLETQQ